ncbi:MAG: HDOD domain-containing protein [Deltaproteobacteria bacterium]|nr:HDOD domain-containing protein [Deltaproteobacteria bacterium]
MIVPTGDMIIENKGLLKAYLASCVGLGLYDTKNQFGGILHILLPEPVCDIPDSHVTYYARTGIPLFIEAMKTRGTRMEDMIAFIAGGALVNPLTPHEMNLNIGHKTLEITLAAMKRYGIPIKMLEASGVNPFCMILNTDKGTCVIEPIITRTEIKKVSETHISLEQITAIIDQLIPVPQTTFSIAHMLSDENVNITSIANEIKKDQVLSATVLRLCNSSYLGISRRIASIDQAIVYLGSKTLIQMVITAQAEKIYQSSENGYSLSRGGMYHHALATARLSERLAKICGYNEPDIAYTAGLLHDIGKVVLDQYIADIQPMFYRLIHDKNEDSSMLERSIFGIDHCHAGLVLTERWNLPDIIKDAILFHHSPASAKDNKNLVNLVYLADVFTDKFLSGLEIEKTSSAGMKESMHLLRLKPQQIYEQLSVIADVF